MGIIVWRPFAPAEGIYVSCFEKCELRPGCYNIWENVSLAADFHFLESVHLSPMGTMIHPST